MVAFCAVYLIHSMDRACNVSLSDWSLFRLATLQELVCELETQAAARHQVSLPNSMSVVHAMARQISRAIRSVLQRHRQRAHEPLSSTFIDNSTAILQDPFVDGVTHPDQHLHQQTINQQVDDFAWPSNLVPFLPDWNLENLFSTPVLPWETTGGEEAGGAFSASIFDAG